MDLTSYLTNRIQSSGYRGRHVAQHNRIPEDKLIALLQAIYVVAKDQSFRIPPGDDPAPMWRFSGGQQLWDPTYNTYFEILEAISNSEVAGVSATFNSLKKNHFPNFEAMGLLTRSTVDDRASGMNGSLTRSALDILAAGPTRKRKQLIGKAMERGIGSTYVDELYSILTEVDFLNVYEIMLFVSDPDSSLEVKKGLIRQYRKLKRLGRMQLHSDLESTCDTTMRLPKVDRRDWHNWWNQARQVVTMLSTVPGFNVYNDEFVSLAGRATVVLFNPTRSQQVKNEALAWHGITSRPGWELHHIYPIEYATCESDLALIDAKENLIYIPAAEHRRIPNKGNLSVGFTYDNSSVILFNPTTVSKDPQFVLRLPAKAAVETRNLKAMRDYNQKLLSSVS